MDKFKDTWDPAQYHRFRDERSRPFHDLLDLVENDAVERMVDLGCGSGELTAMAADRLGASDVLGLDTSEAMLAEAAAHERPGLRFWRGDISRFGAGDEPVDLVLSNAALQWVPDHPAVLAAWSAALRPGGQLAVQLPANADHPSHTVVNEVARESPFAEALGGTVPPDPVAAVHRPEEYAQMLHDLGFARQHVRLQIYGNTMSSTADVVEWVRGTTLTRMRKALPEELFEPFVDRYREVLLDVLGNQAPYFYAFKRILFWARR